MCILSVYTLLKVVRYYDLSVLSMSVMGFQKKKFGWGVGGWGDPLTQVFFWIFGIFLTFQGPLPEIEHHEQDGAHIAGEVQRLADDSYE